jgi:carbon monoxide dehydrogenase subunit G
VDLSHSFTVPASVDVTWEAFNDIESVAECFPGATVTSVEGDEFKGSCKVKLGPISLVYNGTGKFVEKDADAHRFVVEAKGKDKRGNGTAGATVTATFSSPTPESTEVSVVTDLAVTGRPAQFGRGVMQDVSDKLLQAFVDCLKSKVGGPAEPAPEPAQSAPSASAVEAAAAAAEGEPGVTAGPGKHAADPAEGVDDATATPAAVEPSGGETQSGADQAEAVGATRKAAASAYSGVSAGAGLGSGASGARENDALDLGATVLPILVKSYWKQALGALLVLLVLKKLLGRRH